MAACRGGSRSQDCHGYLLAVPVVLRPPADLRGTSSQAHRLAMSLKEYCCDLHASHINYHKPSHCNKIKRPKFNEPCYSCAVRRMSYKMGSVSSFWCHICACKFMLAYINYALFTVGGRGGRGSFKIVSISCKNCFVVLEKWWKDFFKTIIVLKCI